MHVPLTNDFPSGQAHDAPDGLSKQMNSHVRSKHGLGTVSEEKIFLKYIFCIWWWFLFSFFVFVLELYCVRELGRNNHKILIHFQFLEYQQPEDSEHSLYSLQC